MLKINLGCGSDIRKDFINVNFYDNDGVDVVHDLNVCPYPFDDKSADLIIMYHVLEHLNDVDLVLKECYRILKSNGILHIKVPCKKYDTVPVHLHIFDEFSLDAYIVGKNNGMKGVQDIFLFDEESPVRINRFIHFRSKFLRKLGFKSGINSNTFKKYFNLNVNKNHTFGNYKEIEWNLFKIDFLSGGG